MRWRRGDLGGWAIYRGVLVFYYFGHQINVAKVASGREEKKCGMLIARGQLASGGGGCFATYPLQ